jgi:histidinol-phosphate aminotransferase
MEGKMDKYLSEFAKRLTPYVPGEQPKNNDLIKLNTNENPFPPSPKAISAMKKAVSENLRLYPAPECETLRDAIAKVENLPSREYIYAGNGSDEILAFIFAAFFGGEKPLLFPDITYSFYPVYCKLFDINYELLPLNNDFEIELNDYYKDNGGIIFANPNAPTGLTVKMDEIIPLLNHNTESVVVIDEAYVDFGAQSAVKLISKYPNLVIARKLSKSHSLAGLRCGYAMAQPHLIEGIIRVKNSFNSYTMDTIAQAGMTAAVLDVWYKRRQCEKVMAVRRETIRKLNLLRFNVMDSKANFIFVSHDKIPAESIAKYLRDNNIIVRHFSKPERISNYLRISIGTKEQMDILVEKLAEFKDAHIS